MRTESFLIIGSLLLGLCLSTGSLAQQNVRLTLNGLQFSDSLVTITEGDSVTWVFSGQGVAPHHLIAAGQHPGLFSSGAPTFDAFEFTYTFENFGWYRFECSEHPTTERGWVAVNPKADGDTFQIDRSVTGAWFDPAVDGQGFMLDVFEDSNRLFVAWFTFDEAAAKIGVAEHRWFTALGDYSGDTANLSIFETAGGEFNSSTQTLTETVGAMSIRFDACTSANLQYSFDSGLSGNIDLVPVVKGAHCLE